MKITLDTKKVKGSFEVSISPKTEPSRSYTDKTVTEYNGLDGDLLLDENRDRVPVIINGIEYRCYFTAKLVTRDTKTVKNPDSKHSWDKTMSIPVEAYETASISIHNLRRVQDWDSAKQKSIDPAPTAYSTLSEALEPHCLALLKDKAFAVKGAHDKAVRDLEHLNRQFDDLIEQIEALKQKIADQKEVVRSKQCALASKD